MFGLLHNKDSSCRGSSAFLRVALTRDTNTLCSVSDDFVSLQSKESAMTTNDGASTMRKNCKAAIVKVFSRLHLSQ